MAEENKQQTLGEDTSPDVSTLQKQVEELTKDNKKLAKDNEKLSLENADLKDKNADLKVELSEAGSKSEKDTSGVPAIVKYKGVKYTRKEVLADKKLLDELKKMGTVKPQKK